MDGRVEPDIAVEQERKRHDADRQHQNGEQESDANAHDDHRPAGAGREHVADERRDRGRQLGAEREVIDDPGREQPEQEDHQQHKAQCDHRAERGRAHHAESVRPADVVALLAPPAHLVEADRRDRSDQREAGREREDQRQHLVAEREARQDQADQRINDAKEDDVGPVGARSRRAPWPGPLCSSAGSIRRIAGRRHVPAPARRRVSRGPPIRRPCPTCRSCSHPHSRGFRMWSCVAMVASPEPQVEGRGPVVVWHQFRFMATMGRDPPRPEEYRDARPPSPHIPVPRSAQRD